MAELPVRLRRHAALNPRAELREPLTVEDVLASRIVSPPIHKLEAPPWSDGAACVDRRVGARGRASADLTAVALTGWGEAHDSSNFVDVRGRPDELSVGPRVDASGRSRARAARLDQLDVAEVYGAFAPAELMTYEAMGLFGPGEAPAAVARGETALGGRIPINTSGGRLSLGHPPQATPLLELQEVCEQLTGRGRATPGAGRRDRRSCRPSTASMNGSARRDRSRPDER